MLKTSALIFIALCWAVPASARDFTDPTWPCIQRKVEALSLGLMWALPLDTDAAPADPAQAQAISELAGHLALRRVMVEDVRPEVEAFAARYHGDPQALGLVFTQVFDTLSKRRTRIIGGIADFSLGQIKLADKIDKSRGEMAAIMATKEPDFDMVDKLEEQIDWDQVIYSDRQRSISYLCETPTLLERRLFEVAQMLQSVAAD